MRDSIHIIMQGSPDELEINDIKQSLQQLDQIRDVHHTHIWSLSGRDYFFEAHLVVPDIKISQTQDLTGQIKSILAQEFNIYHVTLQYEAVDCGENNLH